MSYYTFGWEFPFLNFIQEHMRSDFADSFFVFITSLGNRASVWLLIIIALLFFKKTRKYAIYTLICYFSIKILGDYILKPFFNRARPFQINESINLIINKPKSPSFPSGHSMQSFACATAIYLCNKKLGIPCLILAFLIAFSRLYLYVHFPTDVLGGIFIGASISIILYSILKKPLKLNQT